MNQATLSGDEYERYSRHLILPEFGIKGQVKLKNSKALVIGAGGLGAPILQYLAAAGVGTIGIVDFDIIDLTNLQRQVLFGIDSVGKSKVRTALSRLQNLNPSIDFIPHEEMLSSANARQIIHQYDLVIDGSDNFPTRYLVNDACVLEGKPLIYGSIFRFEGQVSVFNHNDGPNYRDLFPTPPPPDMVPNCAEGGVLGVLPGIIGSLQANEAIKTLTGIGENLSGKLLIVDAATMEFRKLTILKNPNVNPIRDLIDYDKFCEVLKDSESKVPSISVKELQQIREVSEAHQLIDVREPYEFEICNLGGDLIPRNEVEDRINEIKTDIPVIIHCRTGKRSAEVIQKLQQKGFTNLSNLEGGILKWIDEIDRSLQKY